MADKYPTLAYVRVRDADDDDDDDDNGVVVVVVVVVATGEYMLPDFSAGVGTVEEIKTRFDRTTTPTLPFLGEYQGEQFVVGKTDYDNYDYYLLHIENGTNVYYYANKEEVKFIANIVKDI